MVRKKESQDGHTVHREPIVAALLNFIIWGTGYIYNGKRIVLGIGLLLGMILMHSVVFLLGVRWFISSQGMLIFISHIVLSLTFAYDAYSDSKN